MTFNEYCEKVGLKVVDDFTGKISSNYGATRVTKGRAGNSVKMVVLHTTANNASAKNEAANIRNNEGINSFHAVVDKHEVRQTVRFSDTAHHAGDKAINLTSVGFELTDDDPAAGYENYVKYIGFVMYQLGLTPSSSTVRFHNEFVSTSCGRYLRDKGKTTLVNDITKFYNIAKGEVAKPQPKPPVKPAPKPKPKPTPAPKPTGTKVVAESGYFKPNRVVLIKNTPSTSAPHWGQQAAGDEFEYDAYTISDGHVWVRSKKLQKWVPWRVHNGEKFGSVRLKGSKPAPAPKPKPKTIKVGDRVVVRNGSKSYSGQGVTSAWYTTPKVVSEISGNRVVLDSKSWNTAFHLKDLIKV